MSSYSAKGKAPAKTPTQAAGTESMVTRSQAKAAAPATAEKAGSGYEASEAVDLQALKGQVEDIEACCDELPSRDEFDTLRQLVLALQSTVDLLQRKVVQLEDCHGRNRDVFHEVEWHYRIKIST